MKLGPNAALILIDLQKAIDDPSWGTRNNPRAEEDVARLLAAWRNSGRPVYHVKHDSVEPRSTYRPGQTGNDFKPGLEPRPGEEVVVKHVACAFVGTELEARLRERGHTTLVVCGVITNNSVEATVRMAGCLGFETYLVADGCFTFGRKDWDGRDWTAAEVHALSLANLSGEYCTVVTAAEALSAS